MNIRTAITKFSKAFRRPVKSANIAKERLQIIISHERAKRDKPDYWSALQKDLLDVIARYVNINKDDVRVELERQEGCSVLELNIVLPQE
jgi:cell division topological specificity factor